MRKFLLTMVTLFISVTFLFANVCKEIAINRNSAILHDSISQVYVKTPCRILYKAADTTHIRVSNEFINQGLYFELNDGTLFIKSKYPLDEFSLPSKDNLPTVYILTKNTLPKIKASSSYVILPAKNKSRKHNDTTFASKQ